MFVDIICGARPNFVKVARLIKNLKKIKYRLIHTGQHYDYNMSRVFFEELEIPKPDYNLNAKSGSHAEQTAKIMINYEKLVNKEKPYICVVVGDVNSTLACSIVAKKNNIKLAHIEAGLRSYDHLMPEEINRLVTDSITDYYFTTSEQATKYLKKFCDNKRNVFFVGNIMIDSLVFALKKIKNKKLSIKQTISNKYFLLTLHRPSNVDCEKRFNIFLQKLNQIIQNEKVIFPVHPRVLSKIKNKKKLKNIIFIDPQPYLKFIYLLKNSIGVITDSGGITEEATFLKKPCITLRENTERPETIKIGSNVIVGNNIQLLKKMIKKVSGGKWKKMKVPRKWDGKTALRISKILKEKLSAKEN